MSYAPFPLVWGFFGGGGTVGPAFGVIQTDFGTYPTASGGSDILTLISSDSSVYYFTGTALTDTITLSINTSSASQKGLLSSTDWTAFNSKQNSLGYTPANVNLSNLSTTSINQSLLPNANNTLNLGDTGLVWNELHVSNIRDYNNILRFDVTGGNLYDASSNPSVSLDSYTLFYLGNPILNWSNGNFFDGSGLLSAEFFTRRLYNSTGNLTIDWENNFLYNGSTGNIIFEIDTSILRDQVSQISLDADQRLLHDNGGIRSINYNARELVDNSSNVALSYGTPGNVLAQYDFQANGRIRAGRLEIQGTSGAGYIDLPLQNPNATSGVNGTRLFSNSSGDLSFIEATDGLIRTFSGTLTANQVYTLPNASGTIALVSNLASYVLKAGDTMTGNLTVPNLLINSITQQTASNAYSSIVIDNASGTIRTAPVTTGLQPVIENTLTTPPSSPNAGDSYLVPSSATGAWSGQTNKIATWSGSAWTFYTPSTNDQTTVLTGTNAGRTYIYNGTSWIQTNVTVSAWQLNGNTVGSIKTLGTLDSYDLPFITGAVERMRLTSTGRFGIGTTSPQTAFHLVGTARLASYTIGAIPFIDLNTNLAQDTTSLWWDATNARLALGTSVTGTNYPPTMTSNSAPSPYVASASVGNASAFNAFDNNGSTSWNSGATTGILTIDMGSTITVNQYAVTGPWNVSVNAAPQAWTFEGSPNGSSWTTLDTRTAQSTWAFSETKTYTLSASQSYRYYRLNVTANNGSSTILITQLTISNATTDHVTPLAKAHTSTYLASSSAGAIGQIIQSGQAGQTSDWFQIRDQSANVLANFASTPGTYLNFGDLAGRSAFGAIGTVVAGDKIIFKNGSGDGSTGKFAIGLNTNNNYYIQAIGTTGQPNLDIVTGNSTTGAANVRFTFTSNVLINTTTDTGHKLSIVDTTSAGSGSLAFSTINMATTWNTTGSPSLINGTITATAFGTSSKWANFTTGTANTYLGVLSSSSSANTSEQAFYATNGTNAVLIGVGSGGVAPAGTVYFRVNSSTGISFSSTTTNIPTGYLSIAGTAGSNQIVGAQSASTAATALKIGPNTPSSGALTMTAGGQVDVQIGGLSNYSFAPTSGTATYTQFQVTPTINQTGGANGITRSIYVNPTLTAAADYRALETANGKVVHTDTYSAGSGSLAGTTMLVAPTWNTSGTPTAFLLNVTDTASNASSLLMDLQKSGTSQYSFGKSGNLTFALNGSMTITLGDSSGVIARQNPDSSGGFSFTGPVSASGTSNTNSFTFNSSSLSNTSGNTAGIRNKIGFAPTSGTATFSSFEIQSTINQTGGASGITRSIYVNPTLTSAYDYRAFEATAGKVIMGGNLSSPAWLLNGAQLSVITGTYTDTTSSGTVANVAVNAIAQPGIAASSVTTYTNAATLYIANAPSAGANVTLSNAYALWVGSGRTVLGGAVTMNSTVNASSGASGAFTFGAGVVGNNPTMSLRSANASVEALNISNVGGLAQIGFYNANTASDTRGRIGWNNTNMVVQSVSTPLLFLTDSNERMRIDNSTGYVGVGVTSPSALLSVAGSTTTRASMNIATGTAPTSPNSGDVWHDATQKTIYANEAGVNQSLSGTLFTQTADATCANTTTETTLTSTGVGTLTLPANFFVAGKTIKLLAYGFHSSTSGATVTIRVKLGSTTILTATGASGSDTNAGIIMDTVITCRTTGASGTVAGQGVYTEIGNTPNFRQMTNTAAVTVDTTASQAITMTAQWSAASAGRTITVTNLSVQVLN